MSKNSAVWAAFLVGGLLNPFAVTNAISQSRSGQTSIPELEIRGSSQDLGVTGNQVTVTGEADLAPIELGNPIDSGGSQVSDSSGQTILGDGQSTFGNQQGSNRQGARQTSANRRLGDNTLSSAVSSPQSRVAPAGPVGFDPNDPTSSARSNVAVDPVQTGTAVADEADPFAPTGLRLGTFNVQLSVEQSLGYSSNVAQNVGGGSGAFSQTDVTTSITSDWSRHEWQTNLTGSLREPLNSNAASDRSLLFDSQLRLDLVDGHTVTGRGFYNASTQEFTDTTLAPGAIDTPLQQAYGGSLELRRSDRKFIYALRGAVEQNVFEDANLGGGVRQSQADQDNTLYSIGLRTGYEVSPALTPFVEGIYSIRDFDLAVDRNGNNRDSEILELRGGVEIDLNEKVQGEVSVGYLRESFEDPQIADLTGVTFNGTLSWSPQRDSQFNLTLGTQTNNSITANENGSLTYTARAEYQRQISDRVSADAFAGFEQQTNNARNTTWELGVGMQYWVSRFMALTADIEYQNFSSNAAGSEFDELSGRIGVRLQR